MIITSTIGYPRIGAKREMKKALEDYWGGKSAQSELIAAACAVDEAAWRAQADAGIDLIALDGTFYDHVLDVQFWLGLIPERFHHLSGLDRYFAAARGTESAIALDMSKYFDTNYVSFSAILFFSSIVAPWWHRLVPAFFAIQRCTLENLSFFARRSAAWGCVFILFLPLIFHSLAIPCTKTHLHFCLIFSAALPHS